MGDSSSIYSNFIRRLRSLLFATTTGIAAGTLWSQTDESKASIQPYAEIVLEGWSLVDGGIDPGARSMGLIDAGFDFLLSENAEGHIGFLAFGGDRDIGAFTGDFGAYSSSITDSQTTLFTAWLQNTFEWGALRYGQLAADETFLVAETGTLFLHANFGATPILFANAPAPAYSVGAAGVEWIGKMDAGSWQVGLYAGDPGPGDASAHGVNWKMGGDAGYLTIAERAWNYGSQANAGSVFKIGAYYHSGRFETLETGLARYGNHAFYFVWDHQFEGQTSAFVRAGYNPKSDRSVVRNYIDLGWSISGPLGNRPEDVFGIAYSITDFTDSYLASQDSAVSSREQALELTYAMPIANQWDVQPSVQWIVDSHQANRDAYLIGLRLSAAF